jgi:hypothetical protein
MYLRTSYEEPNSSSVLTSASAISPSWPRWSRCHLVGMREFQDVGVPQVDDCRSPNLLWDQARHPTSWAMENTVNFGKGEWSYLAYWWFIGDDYEWDGIGVSLMAQFPNQHGFYYGIRLLLFQCMIWDLGSFQSKKIWLHHITSKTTDRMSDNSSEYICQIESNVR